MQHGNPQPERKRPLTTTSARQEPFQVYFERFERRACTCGLVPRETHPRKQVALPLCPPGWEFTSTCTAHHLQAPMLLERSNIPRGNLGYARAHDLAVRVAPRASTTTLDRVLFPSYAHCAGQPLPLLFLAYYFSAQLCQSARVFRNAQAMLQHRTLW